MTNVKEKVMNIAPLENRVVVQPLEEAENKSGIFIPDDAKEKSMEGIIIAAGPGLITSEGIRINPTLTKGTKVLYSKFAGTEITYQDEEYLIMRESDVLAILREEE